MTEYEKARKRQEELVSGQGKFTELVKQKLGEKTNYNKDLIEQQNRLVQESLALPSQLRDEFASGPIRNPLQQEALIQGRQSAIGSSTGSVADLLAARGQRESDILASAAGMYGSQLEGAGRAAENAWRKYQDEVQQRQFAQQLAKSGGGGTTIVLPEGDKGPDLAGLEKNLMTISRIGADKGVTEAQRLAATNKYLDQFLGGQASQLTKDDLGQIYGMAGFSADWLKRKGYNPGYSLYSK